MTLFAQLLASVGHFFVGFFLTLLSSDEAKALELAIIAFVKTDIGKLAVDAVNYASTLPGGLSNDALKAAAVQKLHDDLIAAGKDAEALALSTLNLFVEMAYTYIKGTVAALPKALAK